MGAPPVPAAQAVIQQPISTSEFRIPFSISQVALLRSRDLIRFGTSVVSLTDLYLSASRPRLPAALESGGGGCGRRSSMLQCPTHPPAAATRCWRAGRSAGRDLGNRSPLQGWPHAKIPPREAAAIRPDEDPVVRFRVIRRSLRAVAVTIQMPRNLPCRGHPDSPLPRHQVV